MVQHHVEDSVHYVDNACKFISRVRVSKSLISLSIIGKFVLVKLSKPLHKRGGRARANPPSHKNVLFDRYAQSAQSAFGGTVSKIHTRPYGMPGTG